MAAAWDLAHEEGLAGLSLTNGAYFRFGEVAGRMLLTNDAGQWQFLSKDDFSLFVKGELPAGHPEYEGLVEKGFVRDGMNIEALAQRPNVFMKIGGMSGRLTGFGLITWSASFTYIEMEQYWRRR